jgi:hypothetical protein
MSAKHDPQQPAPAGPKDAGGAAEAARQAQAVKAASDTTLIEELVARQQRHLQEAPEVALEVELTARGYHYDPDVGTWVK